MDVRSRQSISIRRGRVPSRTGRGGLLRHPSYMRRSASGSRSVIATSRSRPSRSVDSNSRGSEPPVISETTVDLPPSAHASHRQTGARLLRPRRRVRPLARRQNFRALTVGACAREFADSLDAGERGRDRERTGARKNSDDDARFAARIVYHSCSARRLRAGRSGACELTARRATAAMSFSAIGTTGTASAAATTAASSARRRERRRQHQRAIAAVGRARVRERSVGRGQHPRHSRPSCGTRNGPHRDGWLSGVDHHGPGERRGARPGSTPRWKDANEVPE